MADTSGIDRFFDKVDNLVDGVTRGVDGVKQVQDELHPPKKPAPKAVRGAPSSSTALATRRFRIDEVTDATSGHVLYVVTDGATAKCEFSSRATAEKILEMLEASP